MPIFNLLFMQTDILIIITIFIKKKFKSENILLVLLDFSDGLNIPVVVNFSVNFEADTPKLSYS